MGPRMAPPSGVGWGGGGGGRAGCPKDHKPYYFVPTLRRRTPEEPLAPGPPTTVSGTTVSTDPGQTQGRMKMLPERLILIVVGVCARGRGGKW
jgi:hypothetical protein